MNEMTMQLWALARRSVIRTLRQPAATIPAVTFPLFFLAVISAGAGSAARLPGFPTHSNFRFVLAAGAFLQGVLLSGVERHPRLMRGPRASTWCRRIDKHAISRTFGRLDSGRPG